MALTIFQKSILAAQRKDAKRGPIIYAPVRAIIYERVNLDNATEGLVKVGGNVYTRDSSGNYQKIVDADDVSHTKYVAKIVQSSTNDPVATVYENTFSGTPVWTRTGAGRYSCTLTGEFTAKTVCIVQWDIYQSGSFGNGYQIAMTKANSNSCAFWQNNKVNAGADTLGAYIEIRVYK